MTLQFQPPPELHHGERVKGGLKQKQSTIVPAGVTLLVFTDPTQRGKGRHSSPEYTTVQTEVFTYPTQRDRGKGRIKPTEPTSVQMEKLFTDPTQRPSSKTRLRPPRSVPGGLHIESYTKSSELQTPESYQGRALPRKRWPTRKALLQLIPQEKISEDLHNITIDDDEDYEQTVNSGDYESHRQEHVTDNNQLEEYEQIVNSGDYESQEYVTDNNQLEEYEQTVNSGDYESHRQEHVTDNNQLEEYEQIVNSGDYESQEYVTDNNQLEEYEQIVNSGEYESHIQEHVTDNNQLEEYEQIVNSGDYESQEYVTDNNQLEEYEQIVNSGEYESHMQEHVTDNNQLEEYEQIVNSGDYESQEHVTDNNQLEEYEQIVNSGDYESHIQEHITDNKQLNYSDTINETRVDGGAVVDFPVSTKRPRVDSEIIALPVEARPKEYSTFSTEFKRAKDSPILMFLRNNVIATNVELEEVREADPVIEELEVLLQNETVPILALDVKGAMDRVDDLLIEKGVDEIPGELLQKLDQLGTRFKLEQETGQVVRTNFAVLLADVAPVTRVRGLRIAAGHDQAFTEDMFEFVNDTSSLRLSTNETDALVLLPESVVKCPRRISFVVFRTDRAFRHDREGELNSRVLSVNVEGVYSFEDGEKVEIYLNPFKRDIPRNQRRVCAYWHFDANGTGHWSQEGCELTLSKDGQLDVCRCNHLTHFAEILITRNVFSLLHETILEIISVIGCSLSIFGITIIAVTALLFRSWRINDSNKVWLHLCSPVLLLNVCFLLTVYVQFDQSDITCVILGVALHYSVLATYCWMLVVAILSYRKLVLVFATEIRNKLWISFIFSWGFPLLVIGILLAVDPRAYSGRYEEMTPNGSFCYPKRIAFWVTVFTPIGVMWFVNWCLYGVIVKSMTESRKIRRHSNFKDDTLRSASVSCLLAFICGIPWVFGFFARNIVAAYLFTLTVTFQGFVLFLFFIVGNKKTRSLWINSLFVVREKSRVTSSGVSNRSQSSNATRLQHDDASIPLTEIRL